jgi:hypothetical protein
MEAAVAEKEVGMTDWDDGRLDERFRQIDQRFDQMGRKMDDGFAQVNEGFARVDAGLRDLNGRFDAMQRTLFGVSGVIIAALIGLITTQL